MKQLLELNNEQLKEIEEYGSLLFTQNEVIISMQLDRDIAELDFRNIDSDLYMNYHKGRLTTIAKHRKSIIGMADAGSSPAQSLVEKLIVNTEVKMVQ